MSAVAVRELAEKILREVVGDYSSSRKDVVDRASALIAAAVEPLVRMAMAADFCHPDAKCGPCENDRAELAKWRTE